MNLPADPGAGGRILVVDDSPANLAVLTGTLEPAGHEVLVAADGTAALKLAAKAAPELILLDVLMPEMDGLATCRRLKEDAATRDIPVLFITARAEVESVTAGFQAGGVDYVVKPFQADEVRSRVATHLRLTRLARELREKNAVLEARTAELTAEISRRCQAETALEQADARLTVMAGLEAERWSLAGLVGESPHLHRLHEDIRRLRAFTQTSVLILGESGTGKELVARAIHHDGGRAKGPFVPVNCVAVPADLAESMLFGHVRGAFTGATADRRGFFELAHGGTLFLDEIGDMPASLQVKLLRVLEDGRVTPVGAAHPRKVDVRIIAATNADLDARIAAGTFRADLYFRLARYVVRTPPLRERLEDVPRLATHFLRRFAAEMGMEAPTLSAETAARLQRHPFPGNVRELRNIIERALIDSGGGLIRPEHLQLPDTSFPHAATPATGTGGRLAEDLPLNLARAEDLLIQRALQETGGNIADAARLLGVHRTRIYRKLAQEQPAG